MLTAAHVVGSLSSAYLLGQREVLLRSGVATASSGDPRIGEVIASDPQEPTTEVLLDASLVRVEESVTLEQVVRETVTSGRPRDLEGTEEVVDVYKRGASSGLTHGLLDPTPESLKVELPQAGGPAIVRDYLKGWFVEGKERPFALQGDSGSIVVDADECVVGMVVAVRRPDPFQPLRPEDPAFVIPIGDILQRLEVRLVGPDRHCTEC